MKKILMDFAFGQDSIYVVIEKSQAMPKQGVSSTFKVGVGYGIWLGLLVAIGIPYTEVRPHIWKAKMLAGTGKDKGASILRAKQLFPQISGELNLVKHHNKAEALLLASYGQQL